MSLRVRRLQIPISGDEEEEEEEEVPVITDSMVKRMEEYMRAKSDLDNTISQFEKDSLEQEAEIEHQQENISNPVLEECSVASEDYIAPRTKLQPDVELDDSKPFTPTAQDDKMEEATDALTEETDLVAEDYDISEECDDIPVVQMEEVAVEESAVPPSYTISVEEVPEELPIEELVAEDIPLVETSPAKVSEDGIQEELPGEAYEDQVSEEMAPEETPSETEIQADEALEGIFVGDIPEEEVPERDFAVEDINEKDVSAEDVRGKDLPMVKLDEAVAPEEKLLEEESSEVADEVAPVNTDSIHLPGVLGIEEILPAPLPVEEAPLPVEEEKLSDHKPAEECPESDSFEEKVRKLEDIISRRKRFKEEAKDEEATEQPGIQSIDELADIDTASSSSISLKAERSWAEVVSAGTGPTVGQPSVQKQDTLLQEQVESLPLPEDKMICDEHEDNLGWAQDDDTIEDCPSIPDENFAEEGFSPFDDHILYDDDFVANVDDQDDSIGDEISVEGLVEDDEFLKDEASIAESLTEEEKQVELAKVETMPREEQTYDYEPEPPKEETVEIPEEMYLPGEVVEEDLDIEDLEVIQEEGEEKRPLSESEEVVMKPERKPLPRNSSLSKRLSNEPEEEEKPKGFVDELKQRTTKRSMNSSGQTSDSDRSTASEKGQEFASISDRSD